MDFQNTFSTVAKDLAVNTLAQMAIQASGLPEMMQQTSPIGQSVVLGHGYALSNDIVSYFLSGNSKLLNGEYMDFEDEALFNSLVNYIYMMYDVDIRVSQMVENVSPLPTNVNANLAVATVGVLTNTVRDFAVANSGSNPLLQKIVKPTSIIF